MHTEAALRPHLLHHGVQEDEGAGAANPRTAVHQQRLVQGGRVELADTADEADEGHGVLWHPMVWPGSVVEVCDCQGMAVRL